jgi:exodeoxyribonuclease-3
VDIGVTLLKQKHFMYKFISWNVNGLRAVCGKGFADIFADLDADFFCLQETKLQAGQIDLEFLGYRSFWNYADKKGYSGTAIYTKHDPLNVTYGIGIDEHDHEGRVITLEMDDFYLVCVYVPNAQDELKRLDYRMRWEDDFRAYLKRLAATEHEGADGSRFCKGVIVCGDLNVAHKEIDLKNPKTNRKNPGFTDEERGQFTNLLEAGFTDTFRHFYPDQEDIYSWWSYRFQARQKNVGWRIDYFVTSDNLKPRLVDAKIHTEIFGSDHCPVELTIKK